MRSGQSFLVCKRPRLSPRAPGKWQVAPLDAGTVPAQEPSSPTTRPGPLSALTLLARPPANTALPLGVNHPAGRHLPLGGVSLALRTAATGHPGSSHRAERV